MRIKSSRRKGHWRPLVYRRPIGPTGRLNRSYFYLMRRLRRLRGYGRSFKKTFDMRKYRMLKWDTKQIKKGKDVITVDYQELKFKNLHLIRRSLDFVIPKLFDFLIDSTLRKLGKDVNKTVFAVDIFHPGFMETRGFFLGYRTKRELNGITIFNEFRRAQQSNQAIAIDKNFSMQIHLYEPTAKIHGSLSEYDNLCLPRALVKGMAEADLKFLNTTNSADSRARNRKTRIWKNENYCKSAALKLLKNSKLPLDKGSYNLADLQKIASYNPHYHIRVFSKSETDYKLVFSVNSSCTKTVTLYHFDNHFDLYKEKFDDDFDLETVVSRGDSLDLIRVIAYQKARADKQILHLDHDVNSILTKLNVSEGEIGVNTIPLIAEAYPEYCFRLYQRDFDMKNYSLQCSFNDSSSLVISIGYHNDRFEVFNPTRRKVGKLICTYCKKEYTRMVEHSCPFKCKKCHAFNCPTNLSNPIQCEACNVSFNSEECYDSHLVSRYGKSVCERFKACLICGAYIRLHNLHGRPHVCLEKNYCKYCRRRVTSSYHNCCWPVPSEGEKENLQAKQRAFKILFYDFETVLYNDLSELTVETEQYPNLVCYEGICNRCFDNRDLACCKRGHFSYKKCGLERWAVTDAFINFLLYDRSNDNSIVVAHNGGRFDCHFILNRLVAKNIYPIVIKNGNRIIKMILRSPWKKRYNELEFKDSYALIPVPLAELPKAFNIPNISKGDFPYLFNTPSNYGMVFPTLPSLEYYDPDSKPLKKKESFLVYYNQNFNQEFNFDRELLTYCQDDVRILRLAVVEYIKSNLTLTGWNPLVVSNTFAGFTLHIISHNYLEPNTLGVIHENGLFNNQTQSKLALRYIQWLEKEQNVEYQYFLNDGEFEYVTTFGKFRLDAYRAETNEAVEIMGCAVHGCPVCFDPNADHINKKRKNKEIFNMTMTRVDILRHCGLTVHVIWEHEIQQMLRKNREMRLFFKNCVRMHRLRPRDAFLGGRTQTYKMYHKIAEDEKYERLDVNSLYPYITGFLAEFPKGSPEIIVRNFVTCPSAGPFPYKGLVMLEVVPPKDLPFPILGTKTGNKLIFPLCYKCSILKLRYEVCNHSEEERKLFLTTTHVELNLALENGYKIYKIYEVWHWEKWDRGGIFADFVRTFYKIKQEASGWPSPDMTDEEKMDYLNDIQDSVGVELDPAKIVPNSALKTCAKLMLNSSWGKFGVKINRPITQFFRDGSLGLRKIIEDKSIVLDSFKRVADGVFCVSYKPIDELSVQPKFTNIVISIFTTAYARNYHWQFLDIIRKNLGRAAVTYADTDCIHYVCKKDQNLLVEWRGNVLGKLVDETPPGWKVTQFVSSAPKSYAIELTSVDGKKDYIVKCKGITVDAAATLNINFDAMYKQVYNFLHGKPVKPIVSTRKAIKKKLGYIATTLLRKEARPVMDKTFLLNDYTTVPFGYDLSSEIPRMI